MPRLNRKSRRGSASALIVLMVVLLAVFGALALTGAASDLRLAARRADWVTAYYEQDAAGERLLALARDRVRTARTSAELEQSIRNGLPDGISDLTWEQTETEILVRAVAGDRERGIRITLEVPLKEGAPDPDAAVRVTQWAQEQQPPVYGTEPADIWDGAS